jgi:hypothetical protein
MANNVVDFMPLASRATVAADHHHGLVLTSDRSMPRRSDAVGRFIQALDGFLQRHQGEESYRNQVQWLSAASPPEDR